MGYYYTFYNPENNFEIITSGKFVDMPMYQKDFPIQIPMVFGTTSGYGYSDMKCSDPYNCTGIIDRKIAKKFKNIWMLTRQSLRIGWMNIALIHLFLELHKKLLTNRLWYDIIRLSNEGVDCMEFKRLNSKEYYCVVCGQFGRL